MTQKPLHHKTDRKRMAPFMDPWKWGVETPPLSADKRQAILQGVTTVLGKRPSESLLRDIIATTYKYLTDKAFSDAYPRLADQRKALQQVHTKVQELQTALHSLDIVGRTNFRCKCSPPRAVENPDTPQQAVMREPDFLEQLEGMLTCSLWGLSDLLRDLPVDPGGVVKRRPLNVYIRTLKTLLETELGRSVSKPSYDTDALAPQHRTKQYKGELIDFVEACLQPIDPAHCGPSLGQAIRRALSH